MEKANAAKRTISFFSQKNGKMMTVSSRAARRAAQHLERDSTVLRYEAGIALPVPCAVGDSAGLRASFLQEAWLTDFYAERLDGTFFVWEVVTPEQLAKRAVAEKLELSRRYWKSREIQEWKICVSEEGEGLGAIR